MEGEAQLDCRRVFRTLGVALALACLPPACVADGGQEILDVLFMADIGHPREFAEDLTTPWPMDKSAEEGAFSLYEGLRDYVENQGARPSAVLVLGDVQYGGGDYRVCNDTRVAFQKYLLGTVPEAKVFPIIGNHDIHFLGCSMTEYRQPWQPCYYGSAYHLFASAPDLSFEQWRTNWLINFPGLEQSAIIPPPSNQAEGESDAWLAPNRYNLNLEENSSVYIIAGLMTGAHELAWTEDTPKNAIDALAPGGSDIECSFLRDSLAQGRKLGKTVFVYITHNFSPGCTDWSLTQQIDVWITGHKHTYWQNMENGATVVQEQQHYPARLLIGNGGFDEGHIDVVSFGRLREEVNGEDQNRVLVHFEVWDTCISAEACPSSSIGTIAHCWVKCEDMAGGFDGGGGPRKATPSKYGYGFTLDALRAPIDGVHTSSAASRDGPYKLQLGQGDSLQWIAVGRCTSKVPATMLCVVPVAQEHDATEVVFYDGSPSGLSARIAVENDRRGPLTRSGDSSAFLLDTGFWDVDKAGMGTMKPSRAWLFRFAVPSPCAWQMLDVAWDTTEGMRQLIHSPGGVMRMVLHGAAPLLKSEASEIVV